MILLRRKLPAKFQTPSSSRPKRRKNDVAPHHSLSLSLSLSPSLKQWHQHLNLRTCQSPPPYAPSHHYKYACTPTPSLTPPYPLTWCKGLSSYQSSIHTLMKSETETNMMEPEHWVPAVCNSCGEHDNTGEVFVACHVCNFSICKACADLEIKEGQKLCLRCGAPYGGISLTSNFLTKFFFFFFFNN